MFSAQFALIWNTCMFKTHAFVSFFWNISLKFKKPSRRDLQCNLLKRQLTKPVHVTRCRFIYFKKGEQGHGLNHRRRTAPLQLHWLFAVVYFLLFVKYDSSQYSSYITRRLVNKHCSLVHLLGDLEKTNKS